MLEAWIRMRQHSVYLFGTQNKQLSGRAVPRMVKLRVSQVGLDPHTYSGHSLRAGFATSASIAGWNTALIASQTGYRSQQVLANYVRADSRQVPALKSQSSKCHSRAFWSLTPELPASKKGPPERYRAAQSCASALGRPKNDARLLPGDNKLRKQTTEPFASDDALDTYCSCCASI